VGKIQSQSGISLARVYDVQGGSLGIDTLDAKEVHLTHEMGGQIHSERLRAFTFLVTSGAIAQSLDFGVSSLLFPDSINRLLDVFVSAEPGAAGEWVNVSLCLLMPNGDEMPIWVWDTSVDLEKNVRVAEPGSGAETRVGLIPLGTQFKQTLLSRGGDSGGIMRLRFRGTTAAFGAGTSEVSAVIHVLRPDRESPVPGAPDSHGLPLPSW